MIIILRQDGWQNWGWERFKGWRAWSSEQPGYDQSHLACVPIILENQKSVRSQNPRKGKEDQKTTKRGRSPRKTVAPAILTLNRSNPTFSSQKFWGNSKRQVRQAIAGNPRFPDYKFQKTDFLISLCKAVPCSALQLWYIFYRSLTATCDCVMEEDNGEGLKDLGTVAQFS